ncbi:MAG: tmk [Gammaproteobacteria bacterium]|jgi:dTMP kinase|nr:tmk [Gammaproteobacteria bacterium]
MRIGKFITLEGGEGVGKTTSLDFIQSYLTQKGVNLVVTREPGGTPFAEKIRNVLLEPSDEKVDVDTELLLMFASRAQHLAELIKPAIARGEWVLCSRFTDSTYAYQGGGRGISFERIRTLEQWVHDDFQPDLTLYFDLPVEIGMQRAKARGHLDRIEQEDLDFFERVRAAYLKRAKESSRYRVIDASQSIEQVQSQIATILNEVL